MKHVLFILCSLLLILSCQKEDDFCFPTESDVQIQNHQLKTSFNTDPLFSLIDLIGDLQIAGDLKKGQANSLISKIENAIKSIEKGNLNAATGQLNSFIKGVEGMIKKGALDDILGYSMINIVTDVLNPGSEDSFVDSRDGREYGYVTIGDQTWMSENLAYLPLVSGSGDYSFSEPYYYVYNNESDDVEVAQANENFNKYGVLYNREAAMISCPEGWSLPQDQDWSELISFLGEGVATDLKATEGWYISDWTDGNGDNSSGFTALPGGILWDEFNYEGQEAYFWSSTENSANSMAAWCYYLYFHLTDDVYRTDMDKKNGLSVRCIKKTGAEIGLATVTTSDPFNITQYSAEVSGEVVNDGGAAVFDRGITWSMEENPTIQEMYSSNGSGIGTFSCIISGLEPGSSYYVRAYASNEVGTSYGEQYSFTTEEQIIGPSVFTDSRDGTEYKYISLGSQTWMAENLAFLPSVDASASGSDIEPMYYVYGYEGNDVSLAKQNPNYTTYGVLYNWPAAMNGSSGSTSIPSGIQGVCPDGWHLPSDLEWTALINYLSDNGYGYEGSGSDVGKAMASTWAWITSTIPGAVGYDQNDNNDSGFKAFPAGFRNATGGFLGISQYAYFWSTSVYGSSTWYRMLHYNYGGVYRNYSNPKNGYPVRCLKD